MPPAVTVLADLQPSPPCPCHCLGTRRVSSPRHDLPRLQFHSRIFGLPSRNISKGFPPVPMSRRVDGFLRAQELSAGGPLDVLPKPSRAPRAKLVV